MMNTAKSTKIQQMATATIALLLIHVTLLFQWIPKMCYLRPSFSLFLFNTMLYYFLLNFLSTFRPLTVFDQLLFLYFSSINPLCSPFISFLLLIVFIERLAHLQIFYYYVIWYVINSLCSPFISFLLLIVFIQRLAHLQLFYYYVILYFGNKLIVFL